MYKSAMMFENYQKCLPYFLLFVYILCTYFSCLSALMFGNKIQIVVVICDFFATCKYCMWLPSTSGVLMDHEKSILLTL